MERLRHMVGNFLAIASEHDGLRNAKCLQLNNGLRTVGLDLVVDNNMACILTINRHMDDSTDVMTVVPLRPNGIHHLRVAHADDFVPYPRTDTMTRNLLDIADMTTIRRLIRKGITQGSANGMGREMLDMSSEMEQLVFVVGVRVYSLNSELSMREGARLVEDHGIDLGKNIHIVGTLDEDSFARSTTYASKECERDADDKSARTRNHEEHQGTIEPSRE